MGPQVSAGLKKSERFQQDVILFGYHTERSGTCPGPKLLATKMHCVDALCKRPQRPGMGTGGSLRAAVEVDRAASNDGHALSVQRGSLYSQ